MDFLMAIMASGIALGRVHMLTTAAKLPMTTAIILQLVPWVPEVFLARFPVSVMSLLCYMQLKTGIAPYQRAKHFQVSANLS